MAMASGKTVRIGGAAAAWGDTIHGARQLVEKGEVDYLVGDYLAEVTMALLARARAKAPDGGFIPDWLASVRPVLAQIRQRDIRLVTNSGGMNPLACRDAFLAAAAEAGLAFRVAVVLGDEVAHGLGVSVLRTRILTLLVATVLAATATAVAGPILFVGLIVPHVVRRFARGSIAWLLVLCLVAGPLLMLLSDVLARVLLPTGEVPVAVLTAILGGATLIWVVRRYGAVGV